MKKLLSILMAVFLLASIFNVAGANAPVNAATDSTTLTFKGDGVSTSTFSIKKSEGSKIISPGIPERSGYVFKGWRSKIYENYEFDSSRPIKYSHDVDGIAKFDIPIIEHSDDATTKEYYLFPSETSFVAKWEKESTTSDKAKLKIVVSEKYSEGYDLSEFVEVGQKIPRLPEAKLAGKKFLYWAHKGRELNYDDEISYFTISGKPPFFIIPMKEGKPIQWLVSDGDFIVEPVFENIEEKEPELDITYGAWSEYDRPDPVTVKAGEKIPKPTLIPKRAGYEFKGWGDDNTNEYIDYDSPIKYVDGEEPYFIIPMKDAEAKIHKVNSGDHFTIWPIFEEEEDKATTTLYIQFYALAKDLENTPNGYDLSILPDEDEIGPSITKIGEVAVEVGNKIVPPTPPEVAGKRFKHWATNDPLIYKTSLPYMSLPKEKKSYARLDELKLKNIYASNLGENILDDGRPIFARRLTREQEINLAKEEAENYIIFDEPIEKSDDGYYFIVSAKNGNIKAPINSINIHTKEGYLFLFAIYEDVEETNTYTVHFDAKDGSPTPPDQKVEKGKFAKTPTEVPVKEGYVFEGWYYKDTVFSDFAINRDTTFEARYKKDDRERVPVHFDTDDGSPVPPTQQVKVGDLVKEPETDPAKEGYTFKGWYDAEGKYDFSKKVERKMILYAKYTKKGETHELSHRQDINIKDSDYPKAILKYKKPFFKGYPDMTFKTEKTITRAEMSTVFARILGIENKALAGTKSFSDLDGHWAKDNILRVAEYGLLNGYPDGSFKPDAPMKRAEIAAIINKYWQLTGFQPNVADANVTDIDNHWAKKMILALYNHRFVDLYADKSFKPDAPLKRADVAQILNRITDRPLIDVTTQMFIDVAPNHWAYKEVSTAASESTTE